MDALWKKHSFFNNEGPTIPVKHFCNEYSPYKRGDILWVRETWGFHNAEGYYFKVCDNGKIFCDDGSIRYRPSIHMPREVARIFLRVTDVRVERLREISSTDCYAEGAGNFMILDERRWFMGVWNEINAKRGCGWDANPWVWVYTFERLTNLQCVAKKANEETAQNGLQYAT
jgi:hypothetical protein